MRSYAWPDGKTIGFIASENSNWNIILGGAGN